MRLASAPFIPKYVLMLLVVCIRAPRICAGSGRTKKAAIRSKMTDLIFTFIGDMDYIRYKLETVLKFSKLFKSSNESATISVIMDTALINVRHAESRNMFFIIFYQWLQQQIIYFLFGFAE